MINTLAQNILGKPGNSFHFEYYAIDLCNLSFQFIRKELGMNTRKKLICAMWLASSVVAGSAWSQTASDAAAEPSNDPFVQQRNTIQAANQTYKERVAVAQKEFDRKEEAASKVLDEKVAKARAERNKAVAAAKGG
jgi:hypothetical protein